MEIKNLTQRENEVVEYLVKGLSNREIADKLFVSEHTVKAHVCSILHKLNAKNRIYASYVIGKYYESAVK